MVTMLRVHTPYWLEDDALQRLLSWLAAAPGTFDELAFFTSETHAPLPLETMKARARRLQVVMAAARGYGYRAGINLLATMGHHEENLAGALDERWQRVCDPYGRECRGCYCPEDPDFLDYVRGTYTALAQATPDFLWIDDDVRLLGHGAVMASCFCERCVARFSEESGRRFTRAALAEALEGPPTAERLALRRAWLEHNRQLIGRLLAVIENAVHGVRPGLQLGFMTGDRFYEGYAFRQWAETISGPGRAPVRWRPGAGFYSDEAPIGLVAKAHAIGRQASALPETVTVIQAELENFPYHLLRKSAHTTAVESAAYMAAGATGVAFNMLHQDPSGLEDMGRLLERAARCRPFYDRLNRELGRSRALGVWPAWNADLWAIVGDAGSCFQSGASERNLGAPYALAELGLPICYERCGATVTAMSGRMPLALSRDELEAVLRGGVLLDAPAAETLWEMGLGETTGVRPGARFPVDVIEVFTDNPLNGGAAGQQRNARQSFWKYEARALDPYAPDVHTLCRLTDYQGNDLGSCLSVFENSWGGRVAVAGYHPWSMITTGAKVRQYRALAQWLSRDRLPAVVESLAKVVLWVREGANGRRAAVLLNASLDRQPELELRLRMAPGEVEHVPMEGLPRRLPSEPASSPGYQRVVVPDVAPWSLHLLLFAGSDSETG